MDRRVLKNTNIYITSMSAYALIVLPVRIVRKTQPSV